MNDFTNFIKVIEDYIKLFEELIAVEQTKLEAAAKNRVSFVEDCMHKEQAAVLRMRGLEQKRELEQKNLGMENYTFRQILEEAPDDIASLLSPLFDRLSDQVRSFQAVSGSAREMIEVNLHMIQSALASAEKGTYSVDGKKEEGKDNGRHFTDRTV